jgi:hypothetical protein
MIVKSIFAVGSFFCARQMGGFMRRALLFFLVILLLSTNVDAKKQTYRQPVHLDDAGQPMINSWQKNEEQRQQKKQVVITPHPTQDCQILENGQLDSRCQSPGRVVEKNLAPVTLDDPGQSKVKVLNTSVGSTPTSVLVNRPVQVNTTSQDNQ